MKVLGNLLLLILSIDTVKGDDDFNPLNLVVNVKFKNKKNKEITGFSQEEKDNLVNIHNAYRSLVRPYGADIIEVSWDDEIAAFAQDWANRCTATHRPNRDLGNRINMGENLYWWYSGAYNEGRAVKFWWDEVQWYTMSSKACVKGEVCGHYITMVWAKTDKIGCGVARCDRLKDHPDYGRGAYYFVCNYSGRFVSNIKPYIATDIPCSSCHNTDYPKCRHNLCVTNDMLVSGEGYNGDTAMVGLYRSVNYTSEPNGPTTPTTTTTTTTTTTPLTPTTQDYASTTVAWSMFEEIDAYCRGRDNDYVRGVCWRLNNMLRDELGIPRTGNNAQKRDNNGNDMEGGKIDLRDVDKTTNLNDLDDAFDEIDTYCEDRDSTYKRRVCLKIDEKMKEILGVNGSDSGGD